MMRLALVMWLAAVAAVGAPLPQVGVPVACPRCGWTPPQAAHTVRVKNTNDLMRAVSSVAPNTTILLEDGEYRLTQMIDVAIPGTVLRSRSGDPSKVVLRGAAMTEGQVGVALSVSASDVTIADLTVGFVGYHGIQVRGERRVARVMVHNVRVIDTGQQLLKVSVGGGRYADDGTIACSRFEYSVSAPSDYTNGVDLLATKGWVIRDNTFTRIRGPRERNWASGPAILAWANSTDTLIERNLILESFRGIALGLGGGVSADARDGERRVDHQRGVVRNNVVCNNEAWTDEALEANAAADFRIEHNSVFAYSAASAWSIGVRFPSAQGVVRNNLTTQRLLLRDGGQADVSDTVTDALPGWFQDAKGCDLRLTALALRAIDHGSTSAEPDLDFDRLPRVGTPDIGAFEFRPRGTARRGTRGWR